MSVIAPQRDDSMPQEHVQRQGPLVITRMINFMSYVSVGTLTIFTTSGLFCVFLVISIADDVLTKLYPRPTSRKQHTAGRTSSADVPETEEIPRSASSRNVFARVHSVIRAILVYLDDYAQNHPPAK